MIKYLKNVNVIGEFCYCDYDEMIPELFYRLKEVGNTATVNLDKWIVIVYQTSR